jgi:hypothetical protein
MAPHPDKAADEYFSALKALTKGQFVSVRPTHLFEECNLC